MDEDYSILLPEWSLFEWMPPQLLRFENREKARDLWAGFLDRMDRFMAQHR